MRESNMSLHKLYKGRTRIWVTHSLPGFHRYPDAPDEVAYLRNEHRHMFNIKLTMAVKHDNRDVEFHMFKNHLVRTLGTHLTIDYKSCEMVARELLNWMESEYPDRGYYAAEVNEDGECGAFLEIEEIKS